jgi:phospholipase A1
VGLNHQSNGRSLPLSRSWNRIIFHAAFERDSWEITLRPWIVFDESDNINPSIADYIGRGELTVSYSYRKQLIYLVGTHPLNRWKRGGLQLNYVFPVRGSLRLHLQAFTGYGETLIDYNHYQTTLGLGISFFDW